MVFSKGIVGVMGWRALAVRLYSLALPKIRHQQKRVVEESSHEW
jgi:hypothetical protein